MPEFCKTRLLHALASTLANNIALTPEKELFLSGMGSCAPLLLLSGAERQAGPGDFDGALLFKKLSCPNLSHKHACCNLDRHIMGVQREYIHHEAVMGHDVPKLA